MKTALRLDASGRRCCNTSGCWQPFPCATHATVTLGSHAVFTLPSDSDEACEDCGFVQCNCAAESAPTLPPPGPGQRDGELSKPVSGGWVKCEPGECRMWSGCRHHSEIPGAHVLPWGGSQYAYATGNEPVNEQEHVFDSIEEAMRFAERHNNVAPSNPTIHRKGWHEQTWGCTKGYERDDKRAAVWPLNASTWGAGKGDGAGDPYLYYRANWDSVEDRRVEFTLASDAMVWVDEKMAAES